LSKNLEQHFDFAHVFNLGEKNEAGQEEKPRRERV
jgi:hypothetical protein